MLSLIGTTIDPVNGGIAEPRPNPAPGPIGAWMGTVVIGVAVAVLPVIVMVPQDAAPLPPIPDWSAGAHVTDMDV